MIVPSGQSPHSGRLLWPEPRVGKLAGLSISAFAQKNQKYPQDPAGTRIEPNPSNGQCRFHRSAKIYLSLVARARRRELVPTARSPHNSTILGACCTLLWRFGLCPICRSLKALRATREALGIRDHRLNYRVLAPPVNRICPFSAYAVPNASGSHNLDAPAGLAPPVPRRGSPSPASQELHVFEAGCDHSVGIIPVSFF